MKKTRLILLIILLLGVIVRLVGINFGLPFKYHNDESVIVNYALAYGLGDFNPQFMRLPPLLTYVLFAAYGVFFVIGKIGGMFPDVRSFGFLFLNDPTSFYLIGRVLLGVVPGVISVYLIYRLGRDSFSERAGLLSALFLSVNFLHVRNSHYLYNDIVLTALVIFYLVILLKLFRQEKLRFYFYCGAILGISLSVKYNAVFLAFPAAIAALVNWLGRKRYGFGSLCKKAAIFLCSSGLFFFLTNPFLFLNFAFFLKETGKMPLFAPDFWFHFRVSMAGSMGPAMLVIALFGMIVAIVKRKVFPIILVCYSVIYFLALTRASQTSARYIFPILPVLLLFAAFFLDQIMSGANKKGMRVFSGTVLTILVLSYPCMKTYYADLLFTREDTRTQAYQWVVSNIPAGTGLALDATGPIYPELKKTKQQIKDDLKTYENRKFPKPAGALDYKIKLMLENPGYDKESYRLSYIKRKTGRKVFFGAYPELPVDINKVKASGAEYIILNRMLREADEFGAFLDDVEDEAVLVKEFSPYKEGRERLVPKEPVNEPAAAFSLEELRDRERFGPVIRIYRLRER